MPTGSSWPGLILVLHSFIFVQPCSSLNGVIHTLEIGNGPCIISFWTSFIFSVHHRIGMAATFDGDISSVSMCISITYGIINTKFHNYDIPFFKAIWLNKNKSNNKCKNIDSILGYQFLLFQLKPPHRYWLSTIATRTHPSSHFDVLQPIHMWTRLNLQLSKTILRSCMMPVLTNSASLATFSLYLLLRGPQLQSK